jgi:hypothetical protein
MYSFFNGNSFLNNDYTSTFWTIYYIGFALITIYYFCYFFWFIHFTGSATSDPNLFSRVYAGVDKVKIEDDYGTKDRPFYFKGLDLKKY